MFEKIQDFQFTGINEEMLRLDEVLMSPRPYEYGLAKYIEFGGIQPLYSPTGYLQHSRSKPVKVEGIERLNEVFYMTSLRLGKHFNHFGPVSCHLFISPKDSLSFPMHQDTEDVIIYMISGRKVFAGLDGEIELKAGDSIYIPRGMEHQAINIDSSLMLSFGLERYLEDRL